MVGRYLCCSHCSLLPGVCQVRVDFVDFHLKPSTQGVCSPDNRSEQNRKTQLVIAPSEQKAQLKGTVSGDF